MKEKTISISCTLPASPTVIWPKLQKIETLQYIAAPYATFTPTYTDTAQQWQAGNVLHFRLKVFGFLPMGTHRIEIETLDEAALLIRSRESNKTVPVWRHTIRLIPIGNSAAHYTDEVTIGAGPFTKAVCLWAQAFYRHRQKKWRRLLQMGR